jgi:hypothetical protein
MKFQFSSVLRDIAGKPEILFKVDERFPLDTENDSM